jgi:hypothetical protein
MVVDPLPFGNVLFVPYGLARVGKVEIHYHIPDSNRHGFSRSGKLHDLHVVSVSFSERKKAWDSVTSVILDLSGTGSKPPAFHGWQRKNRFAERTVPLNRPNSVMA